MFIECGKAISRPFPIEDRRLLRRPLLWRPEIMVDVVNTGSVLSCNPTNVKPLSR
jgi:hypothetical protein